MSRRSDQLGQLARLARLKADADLRRYAAYRAHADAMQAQVGAHRAELGAAIAAPVPDALAQWRLTAALVAYRAAQAQRSEVALARMRPGLEAARQSAARAFGRAEALSQLQGMTRAEDRQRTERKRWDMGS